MRTKKPGVKKHDFIGLKSVLNCISKMSSRCKMGGFTSNEVVKDLWIVLLGKTGSGKSAAGNTILGRKTFVEEMSPTSVTQKCTKETVKFNDGTISVIDTPGIFDTSGVELKSEIQNCIEMSLPGPHIFLLVIRLDARFTEEEKNAVKWITENFGKASSKYTLVVFTRGGELKGTTIERYLDRNADLRKLTDECNAGYVVFDNTCMKNRTQVANLLEKIHMAVLLNGGHYTSSKYSEAQRKLWWSKMGESFSSAGPALITVAATAAALKLATGATNLVLRHPMSMLGGALIGAVAGWWGGTKDKPKSHDEVVPL